jgi:hypothetical protein
MVGAKDNVSHLAEIERDSGAQGAPRPVVAAAADRQRKIALTRRANGRLDIFSVAAMDDGARHGADRFGLDSGCGGVAIVARHRHPVGQLLAETADCWFDQIGHRSALRFAAAATNAARRVTPDLRSSERRFVKIPAVLQSGQAPS